MKKRTSKEIFADTLLTLAREEPVERIPVKQIVEASGLSLQTFYNHFRDKEDLILWMHRRVVEKQIARIESGRCSFHQLTMEVIRFYAENANYVRSSFGGGMTTPYGEFTMATTCSLLRAFIRRKRGAEEQPEELDFYLRMYVYACLHLFLEWPRTSRELPAERFAHYLEQGMPEMLKPYLLEQ